MSLGLRGSFRRSESPLAGPQRESGDEVPLEQQEDDEGRQGDDHRSGGEQVVVREELTAQVVAPGTLQAAGTRRPLTCVPIDSDLFPWWVVLGSMWGFLALSRRSPLTFPPPELPGNAAHARASTAETPHSCRESAALSRASTSRWSRGRM